MADTKRKKKIERISSKKPPNKVVPKTLLKRSAKQKSIKMPEVPAQRLLAAQRTFLEVDLGAIISNLQVLLNLAQRNSGTVQQACPMVKANAYGHGLGPVAQVLAKQESVIALGVATWSEAITLRQCDVYKKPIWIFAETPSTHQGVGGWVLEDYLDYCAQQNLVPMVHDEATLKALMSRRQKFHVKINTGMNRLGLDLQIWQKWAKKVVCHPGLEGLLTHMAVADDPHHSLSQRQSALFREALACLHGRHLPYIHFASTSVLPFIKEFNLPKLANVFRPGIGLYGYGLESHSSWQKKLIPAMKWKSRVLKCRSLNKGDWVGYGGSFRLGSAERKCAVQQEAVLGCGYGDGISRSISNGQLAGRSVLGRVSMDLICLEGGGLKAGEWVTILGESHAQALAWAKEIDTIVYEILTAVSERVPRIYK